MIPSIDILDYDYPLPESRIAKYPLPRRDASKLLYYNAGKVSEYVFSDLPSLLPPASLLVFNDTKVVPARLFFKRDSGARIEIFCLEPLRPADFESCFAATATCDWKCVIGNAKRWKDDILHFDGSSPALDALKLRATLLSRDGRTGSVQFCWDGGVPFSKVLEECGKVPIPPYLNRDTEDIDLERYQTTYARIRGSVAAPTAGLHFTEETFDALRERGVELQRVCLHVGAGTFLPVKERMVEHHPMHREPFVVSAALLERLLEARRAGTPVTAVGTTSVRTLESLYYAGVSCLETGAPADVGQWAPYERDYAYSLEESLTALLGYLQEQGSERLCIGTRIIIVPGFEFRIVDRLITNFHQPQSTLLLLISAFLDGDWKTVYDYALTHNFRFLSYGDSSLLCNNTKLL